MLNIVLNGNNIDEVNIILYLHCLLKSCWNEKNKVLNEEFYRNKVGKHRHNHEYIMEDDR